MLDSNVQQQQTQEDAVGNHEVSGAIIGALIGALIGVPLWVILAVAFMGGFAPLGAMGIFGAVKVGVAWGLVLGGYLGLMLKVRQEELVPSRHPRLPAATR